ncbi:MAG: hypothetical protein FJ271_29550 [Planctomycetes bacterium]|nr:hypothetical protein [Planctomycetota bacterium]
MWIKLGNEHLNLDHVVRVRFNRGWKNGQEDLIAEVEVHIKGEVQVFARYRGDEAATLQAVFQHQSDEAISQLTPASSLAQLTALASAGAPQQSSIPTRHDM